MPLRLVAAAVLACVCVACGGSDDAPTAPTPPTFTLSLTSETTTPAPNTFFLERAGGVPDEIRVAVRATFTQANAFSKFRGELLYDPNVLTLRNFTHGTFMQQGGAVVDTSVTTLGNRLTMRIDRPDSLPGIFGTDTVLTLNFVRARPAQPGAASPLQWDDPHAYTADFRDRLVRTYNATVSID